jgi:hypothetical protein
MRPMCPALFGIARLLGGLIFRVRTVYGGVVLGLVLLFGIGVAAFAPNASAPMPITHSMSLIVDFMFDSSVQVCKLAVAESDPIARSH